MRAIDQSVNRETLFASIPNHYAEVFFSSVLLHGNELVPVCSLKYIFVALFFRLLFSFITFAVSKCR